MTNLNISGLPEEEKERYGRLADESGASSRSEFVRQRLRAGVKLWEASGGFDTGLLDRPFDEVSAPDQRDLDPDEVAARDEIAMRVLQQLSAGEATSLQELEAAITRGLVADVLYELQRQNRVENIPTKGYRKLTDE